MVQIKSSGIVNRFKIGTNRTGPINICKHTRVVYEFEMSGKFATHEEVV